MLVRPAQGDELRHCQEIERAAGEPFRELDMHAVADDEPLPVSDLEKFRAAGGLWVAEDPVCDQLVGYVLVAPVDGCAHIEQVSVRPSHARRRIGRTLIDRAAREWGDLPLTLTTFGQVPWNAPYYRRIGFRELSESELTPGLRYIRNRERELGLDRWRRVSMRREPTPN